jgi:NitT/TauT family transport system substrate-binding protein
MKSPIVRWLIGAVLLVVLLGVLRTRPWQRPDAASRRNSSAAAGANVPAAEREALAVGYLPVTCHLTCPVTDFAS